MSISFVSLPSVLCSAPYIKLRDRENILITANRNYCNLGAIIIDNINCHNVTCMTYQCLFGS